MDEKAVMVGREFQNRKMQRQLHWGHFLATADPSALAVAKRPTWRIIAVEKKPNRQNRFSQCCWSCEHQSREQVLWIVQVIQKMVTVVFWAQYKMLKSCQSSYYEVNSSSSKVEESQVQLYNLGREVSGKKQIGTRKLMGKHHIEDNCCRTWTEYMWVS